MDQMQKIYTPTNILQHTGPLLQHFEGQSSEAQIQTMLSLGNIFVAHYVEQICLFFSFQNLKLHTDTN